MLEIVDMKNGAIHTVERWLLTGWIPSWVLAGAAS